MFKSIASKAVAVSAAGLVVLASAVAAPAFAAHPADSAGPFWLADGNTGAAIAAGTTLHWNDGVLGIPKKDDYDALFTGSADAETVAVFLAPAGSEKTPSAWAAYSPAGFNNGSKNVVQPNATLDGLTNGNPQAVKAAGGEYSIGLAFLKNNGLTLASAGVYYTKLHIKPGGDYTFDTPTETTTPTDPNPPAGALTGQIDISATTVAGQDGTLELSIPTGAQATLGAATLVNGFSTSTGKLGQFSVKDGRYVSTPGWDLTSSVADFTNGTDTIAAKQLGVKPTIVGTEAAAVAAGGNTAGTASDGKFASAAAGQAGLTNLNADLTFVAPAKAKAGTYTSKMTLTLVSK